MNERIKEIRKSLNLSQDEFGRRLGVTRGAITNIELNKTEPKELFLELICKVFDVNEHWLRTGKGEMFKQLTEQQQLMKYTALLMNNKDSAVAAAIQALIVTYGQLDDVSKATLEKIALQYIDNLKKSQ